MRVAFAVVVKVLLGLLNGFFDTEYGFAAKKVFQKSVLAELTERHRSASMGSRMYCPPSQETPPEESAAAPAEPEGPLPEEAPDPSQGTVLERTAEWIKRLDEESRCQEVLSQATWLEWLPIVDQEGFAEEEKALERTCQEFIDDFIHDHCRHAASFSKNMRLITVEMIWTLKRLASKGWLPRNLTRPHDRFIREAAGATCSKWYQDPGNETWDIVYHVLQLDQYVAEDRHKGVVRTCPAPYGSNSNKSSVGTINLRGNVLEAILGDFQAMGSQNPKVLLGCYSFFSEPNRARGTCLCCSYWES